MSKKKRIKRRPRKKSKKLRKSNLLFPLAKTKLQQVKVNVLTGLKWLVSCQNLKRRSLFPNRRMRTSKMRAKLMARQRQKKENILMKLKKMKNLTSLLLSMLIYLARTSLTLKTRSRWRPSKSSHKKSIPKTLPTPPTSANFLCFSTLSLNFMTLMKCSKRSSKKLNKGLKS